MILKFGWNPVGWERLCGEYKMPSKHCESTLSPIECIKATFDYKISDVLTKLAVHRVTDQLIDSSAQLFLVFFYHTHAIVDHLLSTCCVFINILIIGIF